jgi:hypothetical protein
MHQYFSKFDILKISPILIKNILRLKFGNVPPLKRSFSVLYKGGYGRGGTPHTKWKEVLGLFKFKQTSITILKSC